MLRKFSTLINSQACRSVRVSVTTFNRRYSDGEGRSNRFVHMPHEMYDEVIPRGKDQKTSLNTFRDKPVLQKSTDVLEESLMKARSITTIKELISLHGKTMEEHHVTAAFRQLSSLAFKQQKLSQVIASKEFGYLCNRTIRVMRGLDAAQLISIFISLNDLKIPPEVLIYQSILQLTRVKINDFSVPQITLLSYILDKRVLERHAKDPVVKALKTALPMVTDMKIINKEFNDQSSHVIIRTIGFGAFNGMSGEALNILLESLKGCPEPISEDDCSSLIIALTNSHVTQRCEGLNHKLAAELVQNSLDVICKSTSMTDDKLLGLFRRSFNDKRTNYSKDFLDKVCDTFVRIIDQQSWKEVCMFAKSLTDFQHVSNDFLDALEKKILTEEPDETQDIISLLTHLVVPGGNWTPSSGWGKILDILLEPERIERMIENSPKNYYVLLEKLCFIGHYRFSVFKHLLETLKSHSHHEINNRCIININLGICHDPLVDINDLGDENRHLLRQQLHGVTQTAIEHQDHHRKELVDSTFSILHQTLTRGLGGEDFVRRGVWTREGSFLDFLIAMRRGNYPVAIGKGVVVPGDQLCFIDDLNIPEDAKLLAVIGLSSKSFLRHPQYIQTLIDFKMRMMRSQGIHILTVNVTDFEKMLPKEQIPFIMREVTQALEE